LVAREDKELEDLLAEFVCVRCVQMGGVDLDVFQFDPLVSWTVFFMRADKTIYGRFGTASPQAKRSKADSNPNHTLAGLKAAMKKALAPGDVIVKVDGKGGWTRSTYLAYLMREKKPGAKVALKVRRGGKVIDVTFRVPKQRPEVLGH
jgi:S1-C subfamily serine protease